MIFINLPVACWKLKQMFGPVDNLDTTQLFPAPLLVFLFPSLLFSCKKVEGHNAVLLAASRHRLFSDWPVSRCAFGKGGVNPDLPLPAGRRLVGTAGMMRGGGWQRGKETAAAWAKRADQRDTGADMVAARKEGGLDLILSWASMRMKLEASLLHAC